MRNGCITYSCIRIMLSVDNITKAQFTEVLGRYSALIESRDAKTRMAT